MKLISYSDFFSVLGGSTPSGACSDAASPAASDHQPDAATDVSGGLAPARDYSFMLEPRTGGCTYLVRVRAGEVSLIAMIMKPMFRITATGAWCEPALSLCWVNQFDSGSDDLL